MTSPQDLNELTPPQPGTEPNAGATPATPASEETESRIPYPRFQAVLEERNTLRAQIAAAEAAAREREEQEMAAQNQHAALADRYKQELQEATSKLAVLNDYEKTIQSVLQREREGLPDHIITLLDALPPAAQLNYLATNAAKLKPKSPAPNYNGADAGMGTPATFSTEQVKRTRDLYGIR